MADEAPQPVELLTALQLCARLQIDRRTLWSMVQAGDIPVLILRPRIHRYDPVAVMAAIEKHDLQLKKLKAENENE